MQTKFIFFFGCAAAFLLLPFAAQAQYAYTITPLDSATVDFHPKGINNEGQISGYAFAANGYEHPFYYSNGQLQDAMPNATINLVSSAISDQGNMVIGQQLYNINTRTTVNIPGVTDNPNLQRLSAFNRNGDIAGTISTSSLVQTFIYHADTSQVQYFPNPQGTNESIAAALNNNDQAAGDSIYNKSINGMYAGDHATLFSNGTAQDLGNQTNGINSQATGINDAGDITGFSTVFASNPAAQQSFLYHNGQYINIGKLPGDANIYAYGISNDGDVIGGTGFHPILYHNGTLSNLFSEVDPSLGWTNGTAEAINDQGWIVGYGNEGGFLMKPVTSTPAPGSLLTFAVGLGALLLAVRRRKIQRTRVYELEAYDAKQ